MKSSTKQTRKLHLEVILIQASGVFPNLERVLNIFHEYKPYDKNLQQKIFTTFFFFCWKLKM